MPRRQKGRAYKEGRKIKTLMRKRARARARGERLDAAGQRAHKQTGFLPDVPDLKDFNVALPPDLAAAAAAVVAAEKAAAKASAGCEISSPKKKRKRSGSFDSCATPSSKQKFAAVVKATANK